MSQLRNIVKIPAPILSNETRGVDVDVFKKNSLKELLESMRVTMAEAKGVGLAANQINENLRLFVIDKNLAKEHDVPDAFINAEITEHSAEEDELEEGCLSIPEFYVPIRRSKKIKIKALGPDGEKLKFKAKGFLARVLQHEVDHLNGITIKDRARK